jgi:hypothetical protein
MIEFIGILYYTKCYNFEKIFIKLMIFGNNHNLKEIMMKKKYIIIIYFVIFAFIKE